MLVIIKARLLIVVLKLVLLVIGIHMKKQTRAQKFADIAHVFRQVRAGEPVKRIGRKDGSIGTKPVVPCIGFPERVVLNQCLSWLMKHHIFCNRHDVGGGRLGAGTAYATYGIVSAGDIIGMLKHRGGQHFEIECKAGKGGTLNKLQRKRMHQVRDNGGLYFVVHGVPELEYYYNLYMGRI